jgi:hypothetical protein
MLTLRALQGLKTPANASFRGVGGRVGHAWGTPSRVATKHSPGAPARFPRLRPSLHHPTIAFAAPSRAIACMLDSSDARAPHPCYVLKICRRVGMISLPPADASPRCQLCSSVRCSSAASGLSTAVPRCQRWQPMRTLGRRRGITVKIGK